MSKLSEMLAKTRQEDFGPNDSYIVSTINNPKKAARLLTNWIEKQMNTAAGIPDLYDNPNPLLPPSLDAQTLAGFNLAGFAMGGSMPLAPKSAGGTLGTFIGPKAATWDAEKAAAAAKMLDAGVPPEQVWSQHLIGRMPDGKLFSEIDDSLSFMKPSSKWGWGNREGFKQGERAIGSLDEFMSHQGISDNYPGFFDFGDDGRRMVMTIDKNAGEGGSFGDSSIRLGAMDNADGSSIANKSTALHELQHAIQQREGWARGGSPNQFINQDFKRLLETQQNLRNRYKTALETGSDPYGTDSTIEQLKAAVDEANNAVNVYKQTSKLSPLEAYNRLTGEAQARATQDRLNMSMDERRMNYPLAGDKLADIPLSQLIYRYGDNGPAMAIDDNLNQSLLQKYLQTGKLTPEELAQYEANAVQMTDTGKHHYNLANANAQGGTPESRAVDLGFDTGAYRGQNTQALESLAIKDYPWKNDYKEVFSTDNPEIASSYALRDGSISDGYVMPLLLKKENEAIFDWNGDKFTSNRNLFREYSSAKDKGHDFVNVKNIRDNFNSGAYTEPHSNFISFKPQNIRSRFAAFDPLRKDSANLLASLLFPAMLAGGYMEESR